MLGSALVYSQTFSNGATPSSQCSVWLSYLNSLAGRTFNSVTISGSLNSVGITLTNSAMATAIANALRTNTAYGPVSSNGYSWAVGPCAVSGGYHELTATGAVCQCNTGYTIRPCIGNLNWGGVNSATCSGSTQTITVTFR